MSVSFLATCSTQNVNVIQKRRNNIITVTNVYVHDRGVAPNYQWGIGHGIFARVTESEDAIPIIGSDADSTKQL